MRMLITGGVGMVGSHCAEYFSKKCDRVIVYDNLMRSKIFGSNNKSVEYNWNYLEKFKNIVFVKNDIRDVDNLNKCFKKYKPDVVIHTAGQPGVRYSLEDTSEDFSINAQGTLNTLMAFKKVNPKGTFIYCSTNKVYGDNVNRYAIVEQPTRYAFENIRGISESESIDNTEHTPYGVSKLTGDLYVQDFGHTFGMKTGIFRMSCTYGTRQFGFEDQGWIAWFAIRFITGKPITIYGDGKQVRDVLWVEDLVDAFDKFIDSHIKSVVFNIGGGENNCLSLLELVDLLKEKLGKSVQIGFDKWRPFDQKIYVSDITKIAQKLNWKPRVLPKEGLEKIIEWINSKKEIFIV